MDYALLRQEGIRQLERMTGGQWTDFNAHDPGITILEQLCYALSDLGYRAGYEIPDLLADGGADPYQSLHLPAEILTSHPVTPADLRRLVLDVEGVKNAWVEPATADALQLYYLPVEREIRLAPKDVASEPVRLRGLYRVLIEASEHSQGTQVRARVARRLHQNRPLCEDFAEITVLEPQLIQVEATVEITPVDDPAALLNEIGRAIADEISPPIPFATLSQRLGAGASVEAMFEGPRLEHGFLSDEVLANATRRTVIHTSDLMRAITDIAAVRAVSRIRVSTGGAKEEWSLPVDPDRVPRMNFDASVITLMSAGRVIAQAKPARAPAAPRGAGDSALAVPAGRDRNVGAYTSVQQHLPTLYGVGEMGLPDSATPARKAQARQLAAYLMFFDQLLASAFAQLANVKDLFSHGDGTRTYFTQVLDQPGLRLEEIRALDDGHRARLSDLVETPEEVASLERKHRFLNHLLARFAEPIGGHEATISPAERARRKQRLLQRYPRISSARGTGFDGLAPFGPANMSGLEERLRVTLGLAGGEEITVVEHILLRPMPGDEKQERPGPTDAPTDRPPALLSAARERDPYSLRLTFVLPDGVGRFSDPAFKQLVENTLRAETPAHLTPYVLWMAADAWAAFRTAHGQWLQKRREVLAATLGVHLEERSS
ncbi:MULTISPECIES: hypothetical protein [Sorangium]|uniref:Uncharacterized protein n=1 Tax=Sorangium cellulosum TaxID=56 RepID=A0A4P2QU31_SORCE|nr:MULTISPECIES: hypothetical protein [Sorangium]AUX33626.1 hypothetical protein SOCE836_057870 [Sorangium cellulosum]WCQ92937.1 hypothetical protein NQZ70_05683 [Sorangium sp. Soce836]